MLKLITNTMYNIISHNLLYIKYNICFEGQYTKLKKYKALY